MLEAESSSESKNPYRTDGTSDSQGTMLHELIRRHHRTIHGLIRKRAGAAVLKHHTVEDLLQETILEALDNVVSFEYRSDKAFLEWMASIAKRVMARCVDDPRFISAALRISNDETWTGVAEEELPGKDRTPSSVVAARDDELELQNALSRLPQGLREVLMLYKVQEVPLSDVAGRLNRSRAAVCQRVACAMAALRSIFESKRNGKSS